MIGNDELKGLRTLRVRCFYGKSWKEYRRFRRRGGSSADSAFQKVARTQSVAHYSLCLEFQPRF